MRKLHRAGAVLLALCMVMAMLPGLLIPAYALTITAQPQNVAVEKNNKTATFTVEAEGEGLTYKWYFKNADATAYSLSSNATASYSVVMTDARNGRSIYCVVTDKNGVSVQSDIVVMSKLSITAQPQDAVVDKVGDTAVFTMEAAGTDVTYKWYYKNATASAYSASSTTSNTYSITMTAAREGRTFYCVATDAFGNSVQSETVSMTTRKKTEAQIVTQPQNAIVAANGDKAVFTIGAVGDGLTYKWYCRNPGATKFSAASVTTDTFSSIMTDARNGREVYCVITDQYGNSVQSDTVVMMRFAFTEQPQDAVVYKNGDTVTFTAHAEGQDVTYSWFYANAGSKTFTRSSGTGESYTITMTEARNGRQVYCEATDAFGNVLRSNVAVMSRLAITTQPKGAAVKKNGDTATVSVKAVGAGLSYRWYVRNPGSSSFSLTTVTASRFSTIMTNGRNGREVYCVVTDQYGNSIQSNTVVVSRIGITAGPQNAAVRANNASAVFSVEAEGKDLTYVWYYRNAGATSYTKSSVTGTSYTIVMTDARDGRQVYCKIQDGYGNTVSTDPAVMSKLYISAQPADSFTAAGTEAAFSVGATGTGLTYEWFIKAPGEAEFTSAGLTQADAAIPGTADKNGSTVFCRVTDRFGNTLDSETASLRLLTDVSGLTAAVQGNTAVRLTWTAVDDASAYDVYCKAGEDGDYENIGSSDTAAFTATGLTANSPYFFKVRAAADANGGRIVSAFSEEVRVRTWCSAGSEHAPGSAVTENRVDPTCTAEGAYDAVVYCTVCGEELSRTRESIPMAAHTAGEPVRENEVPSTCAALGSYDSVVYCTVCGGEISRTAVPIEKLPHTPAAEAVVENNVPPTCAAVGSYDSVVYCTVCEEEISRETVLVPALPHTPAADAVIENEIAGTCKDPGSYDEVIYCTVCGGEIGRETIETEIDATNHVGGTKRMNVIAATCISQGNTGALCCAGCEEIFEPGTPTPIDLTNHVREEDGELKTELRNARAATCAQAGYTGDVCCEYCDQIITAGSQIPALPHTMVTDEPAVTGNCGYPSKSASAHCSVCGFIQPAVVTAPATGQHTPTSVSKKTSTTCKQIGYRRDHYRCTTCGKLFADQACTNELDPADVVYTASHSWSNTIKLEEAKISEATCQSGPVYHKVCSRCNAINPSDTDVIRDITGKIDHNYQPNPNHVKTAATCDSNAVYYKECIYCGDVDGTQIMTGTALGHDYSVLSEVRTPSTCSIPGDGYYTCVRCGKRDNTIHSIPLDEENHPEDKISSKMTGVLSPTCTSAGEYYVSTVCTACGTILAQNEYHRVDPLPHNTYAVAAKAATCTADGNIAYYICSNCGRYFRDAAATQQITKNDTVVARLGHRNNGVYVRVFVRQTTCTVDGLYNEVCYCANGCGTVMDTKPEQKTEPRFNHMRNGVSAVVDVPAAAATCTEPAHTAGTRCTICGATMSGIVTTGTALGHDFSLPEGNVLNVDVQGFYCNRCGVLNPDLLGTYNGLVNSLKLSGTNHYNYNHYVATFGKSVTASNYNKFKSTGIVNILPDVKDQFDAEMRKTETYYTPLYPTGWIRNFLQLRYDNDHVSLLENGDATVTVQTINGVNSNQIIDSSIPNSYTATNGSTYDISKYRNVSVSGDVIVVTVTLKQQKYTPAGGISGVGPNDRTILQKVMRKPNGEEVDIRALAAQYGESGVLEERDEDSGYSMVSRMELKSIVSNGTVTYYFRASDYQPIAAVYQSDIVTAQDVSMTIQLGLSSGSIKVDPYVRETTQEFYLFTGFFPAE